MNFKVNLFFHLYETPFTPFGFPPLIVSRLSGWVGWGGHNGKNKFALKCISGKLKCFKTIIFSFLIENRVVEDPPSKLNGKFH